MADGETLTARIGATATDLLLLADDAKDRFGHLSEAQVNWRPGAGSWSVAQCFEHLVLTQSLYLPTLKRLAAGSARATVWERISPFSGLFGRMLIRALDPANSRKTKTAAKSTPAASTIGGDVIKRFHEHQRSLVDHLRDLPQDLDPTAVVITSPLSSFVTYSLDDCLTILVVHGRRHLAQAERVVASADFPA